MAKSRSRKKGFHRMGKRGGFPVIALLILLLGVSWLGNDLGWWQFDFPFWPLLIIVIAVGWIIDYYSR